MNTCKEIISDHLAYRKQLVKLAKSDIKKTYSGAVLGWAWAVIRPAILIFVFWFAFTVGLRKGSDVDGYPFFLWLIAGMILLVLYARHDRRRRRFDPQIPLSGHEDRSRFPRSRPLSVCPGLGSAYRAFAHYDFDLFIFRRLPTILHLQRAGLHADDVPCKFTTWGLFSGVLSAISQDLNLVKSLTQALFCSGLLVATPERLRSFG